MMKKTLVCDVCEKTIDVKAIDANRKEQDEWRGIRLIYGKLWIPLTQLPPQQQDACSVECMRVLLNKALDSLDKKASA